MSELCQICNKYIIPFVHEDDAYRRCPNCGALLTQKEYVGGDKLHYYHEPVINILDKINLKNKKVLEIGCAGGVILRYLNNKKVNYVGIDLKRENLKGLEEFKTKVMDARDLKFGKETFDIIIACETFEHINNVDKAIKEVRRVLKKEGIFIITVPNDMLLEEMWCYCGDKENLKITNRGHINKFYDKEMVQKIFNGFKIIDEKEVNVKLGFFEHLVKNKYIKRAIRIMTGEKFNIHNCFVMKKDVSSLDNLS